MSMIVYVHPRLDDLMIIFTYFPSERAKPIGASPVLTKPIGFSSTEGTPCAMSGHRDVLDKAEGCH